MKILRFVAPIIAGTSFCFLGYSPASAYEVQVTEGIVYGHGEVLNPSPETKPLLLDLYEPVGPGIPDRRRPAVLMIHGGGFVGGSRQFAAWVEMATELAKAGYVVASIDYRLGGEDPVPSERVAAIPVTLPFEVWMVAALDDALTALDWLFANSDTLYLDPSRFGVMGGSAGAITAIHQAYTMNGYGIDALALTYVVDLWGAAFIPFFDPVAAALFDPVIAASHIEAGEPPIFIVHGVEDPTIPISYAELLVARAEAQGVPHEYHPIAGAGHGFDFIDPHVDEVEPGVTIFDRMVEWIDAALPIQVEIDIKPWHSSNRIFPWFGRIPVAVLGSADFSVSDIDRATLAFGRDGAAALSWAIQGFDVNDDQFGDLIVFFRASQSGTQCYDPVATLTGRTDSGDSFSGADSITTVGCF